MSDDQHDVDASFHEGVRRMRAGDRAGAQDAFRTTLQHAPGLVEAHINLGLLLAQDGQHDAAEAHYRVALSIDPGQFQAHLHLGALLAERKRFTEAEHAYRQALALDPNAPAAWSNLGVLLACMQQEAQAEACHRTALALAPEYRNARFNLAYLLLRQGRFDEGWPAFEARDWYAQFERYFAFPRWRGEALDGKRLLIGFEAGHGDMIQFCRYASVARARGAARVGIVCHPGLATLFTRLEGVDTVLPFDGAVPRTGWDYWMPPLSFPLMCKTDIGTIPATLPYLRADPAKAERLAHLTACPAGIPRVGLAWQGNPKFENDADRSLPSAGLLAPLLQVPGIRFFSLQKGGALPVGAMTDLAPHIADFDDTAALIANLDLVISVDTAVAHLAGAMNLPCWLLLPDYRTDWRWLTGRDDSPWYPGMRLFRQTPGGAWPAVIDAVRAALEVSDLRAGRSAVSAGAAPR